ncbi:MAG: beta-ketoacyl-ACP synthase II [Kiritimatiellae bacterium]|nr:beta-ketoacyl-ACP synthase II [Kiritimatiellia bacterium]MCO5062025.1 beta-ketoacyl-ACP synthase II [Kiritimatiellia bacterium]MCO6401630.1 beta-ketoacyl-ACP synthase II [Verrucomicrobiota bacterium]
MSRRVAVTGLGVVSPLGCDHNLFFDRLLAGQSGVRRIQTFDVSAYASQIAGEVVDFEVDRFIPKKEQRRMDPFCHYGIAASKLAVQDAGVDFTKEDPTRCGALVGSGIGGLQILEEQMATYHSRGPRFSPFMIPQMITNILAGYVAIEYGLQGPNYCITSACATATHCLGESMRLIRDGEADVMLAGGAEGSICVLGIGGFCAMRALSTRNDEPTRASRPFDRGRDGFVIAEGAGVLLLEEMERAKARGAHIYCELAGYGRTCDAYHITAPHEQGAGASRAMANAIADAKLRPEDITYVNPHATSTQLGDLCEIQAVKTTFGEHAKKLALSATKSMIGHGLGAAGGLESVALAHMIEKGVVHPTINLEDPDAGCDLDFVPHKARELKINAALKNSFGFGGHNATLCFKAVS